LEAALLVFGDIVQEQDPVNGADIINLSVLMLAAYKQIDQPRLCDVVLPTRNLLTFLSFNDQERDRMFGFSLDDLNYLKVALRIPEYFTIDTHLMLLEIIVFYTECTAHCKDKL
jgi:hypothetical protein